MKIGFPPVLTSFTTVSYTHLSEITWLIRRFFRRFADHIEVVLGFVPRVFEVGTFVRKMPDVGIHAVIAVSYTHLLGHNGHMFALHKTKASEKMAHIIFSLDLADKSFLDVYKRQVEHNIKEAAAKHAEHREAGIAVVTHKRDEQVVEDKRTGKYHQQLEVG